ncbi:MAG: guanylate kinase [Deltaproteobacteria bacterium]|nr:guanylate kinase [Deltaproteobacteria bacterium]
MSDKPHPRVFVISGPSGVGKSTLIQAALRDHPDLVMSISHTTRPPRHGESNGVHYFFVNREIFQRLIEKDGFLEWAEVYGNLYGTSRDHIHARLREGHSVLLDIDTQGAHSLRELSRGGCYIFVAPPSLEALRQRLVHRGTETPESLSRRMNKARDEMTHMDLYDHVVVNDKKDTAALEFLNILNMEIARNVPFRFVDPAAEHDEVHEEMERIGRDLSHHLTRRVSLNIGRTLDKTLERLVAASLESNLT